MISFLVGVIEEKAENTVVFDVNGVGYELAVSNNTLVSLPQVGESAKIFCYMAIREDAVSLIGFATREERDLFYKLIIVSGVGPKLALSILSGMKVSDLQIAIIKEEIGLLSKIKGLGKKTAERICLELKDKLSVVGTLPIEMGEIEFVDEDVVNLATETLISLGINKNEAYRLARSFAKDNATVEEIISKSLRGYRG